MFDPYAQPTTARNKRSNPLRTWQVYSVLLEHILISICYPLDVQNNLHICLVGQFVHKSQGERIQETH